MELKEFLKKKDRLWTELARGEIAEAAMKAGKSPEAMRQWVLRRDFSRKDDENLEAIASVIAERNEQKRRLMEMTMARVAA